MINSECIDWSKQHGNGSQKKSRKLNRRNAIRARCLDCSAGSVREIRECPFTDCPLWLFRMGLGKQDPRLRNKAIRSYCIWCSNGKRAEVPLCQSKNCPLHSYRKAPVNAKTHQIEWVSREKILCAGESIGAP